MKVEIKPPFFNFCSKISLFNNNKLTDMQEWEKQSIDRAKIKLYPTFNTKSPTIQAIDNLEKVQEAFIRASKRANAKMLASEEGKEILADAEKYNIPYDPSDINWFYLMNAIEDYEELLQKAKAHNINWDYRFYDPIGLKQEIEEDIMREIEWSREQNSDYFHSRM